MKSKRATTTPKMKLHTTFKGRSYISISLFFLLTLQCNERETSKDEDCNRNNDQIL
jgi:hypothetical protein